MFWQTSYFVLAQPDFATKVPMSCVKLKQRNIYLEKVQLFINPFFLQETNNLNVCANTVKILSLLILRNKIVNETDRSIIRKVFINPTNFKAILDAFRNVNQKFGDKENNQENVIRLIRVLNCLYVKRGTYYTLLTKLLKTTHFSLALQTCLT